MKSVYSKASIQDSVEVGTSVAETTLGKFHARVYPVDINAAGATLRVRAGGIFSNIGGTGGTTTFRVYLGSTELAEFVIPEPAAEVTAAAWSVDFEAIVRTAQSSIAAYAVIQPGAGTTRAVGVVIGSVNVAAINKDLTTSQVVTLTAQMSVSNAANLVKMTSARVEILQPNEIQ